ncbi:MAG: prepilin-type N-terminal cleavage/methylation domain-containing protein [bacterium]|nr:prepilin-type N-terminal cleavage/methylation domain-containing protein [bacterium]
MAKSKEGFTIVELLVVIVVIAILAAITLVSYNGIQRRAHNTVTTGAVSQWIKVLTASYLANGVVTVELPAGDNSFCLGTKEQYPYISEDLKEGQCYIHAHTSDELNNFISEMANVSMSTYVTKDGSYPFRGIQYVWTEADDETHLWYNLEGEDQDCAVQGSEIAATGNGITECHIVVSDIIGANPIRN